MAVTVDQIIRWLMTNPNATQADIDAAMAKNGVTPQQVAQARQILPQAQQLAGARSGATSEQALYQKVADYARANNIDPQTIAYAAGAIAPNPQKWTSDYVTQILQQYPGAPQQAPPIQAPQQPTPGLGPSTAQVPAQSLPPGQFGENYGLAGTETAMLSGAQLGLNQIGQTQQNVSDLFSQGAENLQPFATSGTQANNLQAALSGALGPEAQKQAFSSYQMSPGAQFAQEESERAITRNAAAIGGLGGGNVRDELSRRAVGTYMQDFGNQFNRLGEVANRGYGAASSLTGLKGAEAGIQSGLGQYAASIPVNVGASIGQYRYQAGSDLANSVSTTTSALSNLLNQQGAGISDIVGGAANNINTLFSSATAGDVNAKQQLATLLANISSGGSSQFSGQPIIPGATTNLLGQLGQVAGGVGGLAYGLGQMNQPTTQPATSSVYPSRNPNTYASMLGY
jgi:hypothetical protein